MITLCEAGAASLPDARGIAASVDAITYSILACTVSVLYSTHNLQHALMVYNAMFDLVFDLVVMDMQICSNKSVQSCMWRCCPDIKHATAHTTKEFRQT